MKAMGDVLMYHLERQSDNHEMDLLHPRELVELSFEMGTIGGLPSSTWQQVIVQSRLLYFMYGSSVTA